MIIRDQRRRNFLSPRSIVLVLLVAAVLVAAFFIFSHSDESSGPTFLFTGMENVKQEGETTYFVEENVKFDHGETQTDNEAHSGKYSSMIYDAMQFGPTWETEDFKSGYIYEARIWRKSVSGKGSFIASGDWGFYKKGVLTGQRSSDGWEEMLLKFEIPKYIKGGKLKIYTYNPDQDVAFFDDLEIRRVVVSEMASVPVFEKEDSIRTLNILLGEKGEKKIRDKRDEALRKGILKSADDDWVKCKIEEGKQQFTGKLRLKGDWTDHLKGDKWSFRISLATGQAWNRLVVFSVQSPDTRYMLSEWVYHRWLHLEDVLTPRYDFIHLKVNNVDKGVFAWEEHFVKQIPEYNMRREGPILKFIENGFWDTQDKIISNDHVALEERVPIFRSSDIEAFGMSKIAKDSALTVQFQIAQNLMHEYKTGQKSIWDVFDVERMARYFAIVDVTRAHHGFIWHNQRIYYNPVISRLEPIGFDGYTYNGPYNWLNRPFLGFARNIRYMRPGYKEQMFERFFHDERFVEKYIRNLYLYTSEDYLDQFFATIGADLKQRESWLRKEWRGYRYDYKFLYDEALKIRLLMMPMEETSLKAHKQEKLADGTFRYKVFNYHCLPIHPIGLGKKRGKVDFPFTDAKLIDAYANEFPAEFLDLHATGEGKYVMFRIPGIDSIFSVEAMSWKAPEAYSPEQELFSDLKLSQDHIYEVDSANKKILFRSGKYRTDRDILIPAGWQVWFDPGVELDLIKKAKFISKSQVLIFGDEDRPVTITSSDKSANGFTILNAEKKSEFHYVVFDNLNTLAFKGWNLTGAVTLYESEVLIKNSRFVNNHCEDGLNLVRCIFNMTDSYVGYTFADGFDADFCNGNVTNCFFSHTGNDGMDFSGSHINILRCEVEYAGDKGISLGEESTVDVKSTKISNSVIGLVAKDLTQVTVGHIELIDNQTGFAAYQKKPEYGPANITVKSAKMEGNGEAYLLQEGSTLQLGDKLIKGKR